MLLVSIYGELEFVFAMLKIALIVRVNIMSICITAGAGPQVAAAETQNPRHNIPKAAKRVFWRFLIFYLITIFMMGLIVPSNDKGLMSNSGDAGASPFAIAANNVGIKTVPSIINAVVVYKCMERW
ncbi:hypothetical protein PENFLA_c042G00184 [Penicillium flavigenum]|uniref:Amino acid permease/ SLC12A domain-containing protein n=1 Tax=Penicillium flavigenum TaxID=254877 RepID=A0A1V6SJX1_9EURO|nr:hypothetical protein PENFLA_c042G00184 [Penicillium flavigenum]